jgi:hypothetical protein
MTEWYSVKAKKIGLATESLKMLSKNKTIRSREEETDGLDQVIWEISDKSRIQSKIEERMASCELYGKSRHE